MEKKKVQQLLQTVQWEIMMAWPTTAAVEMVKNGDGEKEKAEQEQLMGRVGVGRKDQNLF